MLSREQNEMLTQTTADTPMGQFFRRFWQPVALVEELPEPDCPPVRVTIMGEDLVAFRDTEGRVGLIDARCPHRGANMFFGRNENCGLRCVYHGWKFDVGGRAIDLPNVPVDSKLHETIRTKAYPCREAGEIIWAYMGPAAGDLPTGALPEVPLLEFACVPNIHRYVTKQRMDCNWAQIVEGDLDTSHFSFLHMPAPSVVSNEHPHAVADEKRMRWMRNDPIPRFQLLEHEVGFVIGGARAADGRTYWRMTQFMLPSHGTGPSTFPGETYHGFTVVPIHDEACWVYCYSWNPERPIEGKERDKLMFGFGLICERDEHYYPIRNVDNDFMIDRSEQRHRTFTGVKGLAEQDAMIQHSQGPIADRTRETLTTTDAAVVRFRSMLLKAAAALENGEEPTAPARHVAYRTRPGSWLAEEGKPLEEVMLERFQDTLGRVAVATVE